MVIVCLQSKLPCRIRCLGTDVIAQKIGEVYCHRVADCRQFQQLPASGSGPGQMAGAIELIVECDNFAAHEQRCPGKIHQ